MWNLKCTIIPVRIGATGIVTRSLRKNLEAVPGKHSIDSLQKTAILGTSHIIRKVLQCEARSLSGGDHRWFKRSTGEKRPVTRDIHIYNNNNNNEMDHGGNKIRRNYIGAAVVLAVSVWASGGWGGLGTLGSGPIQDKHGHKYSLATRYCPSGEVALRHLATCVSGQMTARVGQTVPCCLQLRKMKSTSGAVT